MHWNVCEYNPGRIQIWFVGSLCIVSIASEVQYYYMNVRPMMSSTFYLSLHYFDSYIKVFQIFSVLIRKLSMSLIATIDETTLPYVYSETCLNQHKHREHYEDLKYTLTAKSRKPNDESILFVLIRMQINWKARSQTTHISCGPDNLK